MELLKRVNYLYRIVSWISKINEYQFRWKIDIIQKKHSSFFPSIWGQFHQHFSRLFHVNKLRSFFVYCFWQTVHKFVKINYSLWLIQSDRSWWNWTVIFLSSAVHWQAFAWRIKFGEIDPCWTNGVDFTKLLIRSTNLQAAIFLLQLSFFYDFSFIKKLYPTLRINTTRSYSQLLTRVNYLSGPKIFSPNFVKFKNY